MILLILDVLLSFFSIYPIFLFLLNILLIPKNNLAKFIIHSLILDILLLETSFLSTFILTLIFIIYKKLPLTKLNIINYLLSISLIFFIFNIILGLINNYSFIYLITLILKYYLINLPIYILCYKILYKRIKLAR